MTNKFCVQNHLLTYLYLHAMQCWIIHCQRNSNKKARKRNAKALILEREAFTGIPILHEGSSVKKKYFTLQENWAFVHYIQSTAFFNEIHKLKEEATIPRSATATRAVQNSHVDQTGERFITVIPNNRFLQASSLLPSPRKTISSFVRV